MPTTTGDPRIDGDERVQAWIEAARPLFTQPDEALLDLLEKQRADLRACGVERWTADLRAVLWAGFITNLRATTAREWNTCFDTRTDYEHWLYHRNDNWAYAAAVLVMLDQRGL